MGRFAAWMTKQGQQGARRPTTVEELYDFWLNFAMENASTFNLYERYKAENSISSTAKEPAVLVEEALTTPAPGAAPPVPAAAPAPGAVIRQLRDLANGFDRYSDEVFELAEAQRVGEKAEMYAHRRRAEETGDGEGKEEEECVVRLQVQINFKTKKTFGDTLSTRTVKSAGGVTVTELDQAYQELRKEVNLGRDFKTQMDAAWLSHKNSWGSYVVGNSYSVYFDNNKIVTAGRPSSGYRLDVENLRVAAGKQNFI